LSRRVRRSAFQARGQRTVAAPARQHRTVPSPRAAGRHRRRPSAHSTEEHRRGPRLRQHHRSIVRTGCRRCSGDQSAGFDRQRCAGACGRSASRTNSKERGQGLMKGLSWSGIVALVATLAACSFAPAYRTPDNAPPAPVYKEAGDWQQAGPLDEQARGAWWMLFQDPQLDALEAKVGGPKQNPRAPSARLRGAGAATRIARADLFPTLSLGASAARARSSAYSPRFPAGQELTLNNFDLEADLSYEVDLWGRVRNTVNAANANRQASAADLASLDLALHAELATDYYTLRSQDAEQVLLEKTVEDYSRSLQLAQHLYRGGAAAVADVDQAQAQLETARTQAADIALQRAQ